MPGTEPLEHRGALAVGAVVALAASYVVAIQDPLPKWELRLTVWLNDWPDAAAKVLYPIMQLGTVGLPILAALVIAVWKRDWVLSGLTVLAGLVAWFGAKWVKSIVERGRPLQYIPDLHVREGSGTGLGYVSGHSAVVAATAVIIAALLPRRWRWVPALAVVLVGIGRIVHGVHLPADVVGGWGFGVLVGLGTLELDAVVERRRAAA